MASGPPRVRFGFKPHYESDEIAVGIALAIALHVLPVAALAIKASFPSSAEDEQPIVAKPVIAANLLKLGAPIDPKKLPDRFVPRARTAPKKELVASRDEPKKPSALDAGPPPPNTQASDLERLIAKTDPFAEDAGKDRPEEGHPGGIDGGNETDPNKVRAGDMYAALLGNWFKERWQIPTVISQGEANRLCVSFQISLGPRMNIWHVRQEAVRKSGNELFDDSARSMLQKIMEDGAALPQPPPELIDQYRGKVKSLLLAGNAQGDASKCR